MRSSFFAILCFFSTILFAQGEIESQPVQQTSSSSTQQVEAHAVKGQETYEHFCITCHQEGLAGAPKINDEKDWKSRLAGKTIDDLVSSATKGLNVMPAQGTCTECSNEDLRAAIEYMLPKS